MDQHESQGAMGGGQKPVRDDEGEHGLGTKTGGEGGHDQGGKEGLAGGGAEAGPTKDVESVPGGGDDLGPTPGGVPQEGEVDRDADSATGSTESGPNPADHD